MSQLYPVPHPPLRGLASPKDGTEALTATQGCSGLQDGDFGKLGLLPNRHEL